MYVCACVLMCVCLYVWSADGEKDSGDIQADTSGQLAWPQTEIHRWPAAGSDWSACLA